MPPPRLPLRFFRWFCHPVLRKYIEGDLLELYEERVKQLGKHKADRKFIIDVLLLFRPGIIKPSEGQQHLNQYDMLSNYLKVGFRNILKYRFFSSINIFGLAVAMSVSLLIILMLADQWRYDKFHVNKDRTYRILSSAADIRQPYATSPYPLAQTLKSDYPIVEDAVSLTPGIGGDARHEDRIVDLRGYFTDGSFFQVFSFGLMAGDPATALDNPRSVVLSKEAARLLFGDEDPLGKTFAFTDRQLSFPQEYEGVGSTPVDWGSFTVTGVVDLSLHKSHLRFDALVSASTLPSLYATEKVADHSNDWASYWRTYTYALVQPGNSEKDLVKALDDLVGRKYKDLQFEQTKGFGLQPQPLTDVQLGLCGNDTNNRLPRIGYYFLGLLALVVMVSACLNYTNLSVARALTRSKEIGVRKVTGAGRASLMFQFLSESVLTSLLSLMAAIGLVYLLRPGFKNLWVNQYLEFELPDSFAVYAAFVVFSLLIGVIAGIFPALHMSGYQPIRALKSQDHRRSRFALRKVLSASQFIVSLFFITTSILIFNQFRHYMTFDYGFTTENIVNVPLQGNDVNKLTNAFQQVPGVSSISASDLIPAAGMTNAWSLRKAGEDKDYRQTYFINADENFLDNLGIKLIAGRNLPDVAHADNHYILLNAFAVKAFGFPTPADAVGAVLEPKGNGDQLEVIGVVEDFRFRLLLNADDIGSLAIGSRTETFQFLEVKMTSPDLMATVGDLEKQWKSLDPVHPFHYSFLNEQLAQTHQGILDLVSILGFIAFLAIVIACLGLLGMATYTAERRTREVGIRKVMGAAERTILLLLSKEFVWILLLAVLIGAPFSFFVNNLWLEHLPNRVDFGWGTVVSGTITLLILGVLTVGSQAFRAARKNPVDALKE